jgi:hypothetical protein
LRSTGPSDDIVSRLQSGGPESLNFSCHIIHNQLDPVPAPGTWTLAAFWRPVEDVLAILLSAGFKRREAATLIRIVARSYSQLYLASTGGICAPEPARGGWSPSVAIIVPGDRRPRKAAHEMCGRATVAFNAEIASAFGLGE